MDDTNIEVPQLKICWNDNDMTVEKNKKDPDLKGDNQKQDNVHVELRHLLIYLSFLGCFHFKQWPQKVRKIWLVLSVGFSINLVASVWVCLIISIVKMQCASQKLSLSFSSKIIDLMLYFQSAVNGTIFFVIFWKKNRFALLLQYWNTLSFGGLGLRKRIWLYSLPYNLLTLSVDIIIVTGSIYQVINTKIETMQKEMCFIHSDYAIYLMSTYDVLATAGYISLMLTPFLLLTALSVKLVAEMDILINGMKKDKENGTLSNHVAIQKYRLMYEKWAKVVSHGDLVFGWYYGFSLTFGIPIACFLGYNAFFDFQLNNVYLGIAYLFAIIVPCIPAAVIANNVSRLVVCNVYLYGPHNRAFQDTPAANVTDGDIW